MKVTNDPGAPRRRRLPQPEDPDSGWKSSWYVLPPSQDGWWPRTEKEKATYDLTTYEGVKKAQKRKDSEVGTLKRESKGPRARESGKIRGQFQRALRDAQK